VEGLGRGADDVKEYNFKQSAAIVVVGFALLWACLSEFVFPFLVGGGPANVSRARSDERQLLLGIEHYKREFGTYPAGENASIVRALAGDNPKKLRLIHLNANSTNESGEFTDPWKMPYKIAFDGTNRVTVSSAGINRSFGNKDDIVFHSGSNNFVKP